MNVVATRHADPFATSPGAAPSVDFQFGVAFTAHPARALFGLSADLLARPIVS